MKKGTVDRIEDGEHAVIVLSSTDEQTVCAVEDLPHEARHSGAVIELELADEDVSKVNYLPDEEETNRERISRKRDEATDE